MKKIIYILLASSSVIFAQITPEQIELQKAKEQFEVAKKALANAEKKFAKIQKTIKQDKINLPLNKGEEIVLTTKTGFSYSNTSGNTDTERFSLDFHAQAKHKKNKLILDIDVLTSNSDGTENNNKWLVALQYDRELSEKIYFNYLISYGEDQFSGFDYQFNTGPGLGYKAIKTKKQTLNFEVNSLYSEDKLKDGNKNSYVSALVGLAYKWQVVENFSFSQDAYYKAALDKFDNYFIYSKSSIENKINNMFSMGLSYKINYKNTPAENKERIDKTFLASFIINY